MNLEEKILFLQEELSKDPNSYPELKREVESAFNIDINKWESYKNELDNGYQLTGLTLLTGRRFSDPDVGSESFTNIYVTTYIALMPKCLIDNLPYFQEYIHLGSEEEFLQYIEDFKEGFIEYLTYEAPYMGSKNKQDSYYRLMETADVVLNDLIACGKVVVLETTRYKCHDYGDGTCVTSCGVKNNTAMGKFVTNENGQVTFEFACPSIKSNILDIASGRNLYESGEQMVIKSFNERATE